MARTTLTVPSTTADNGVLDLNTTATTTPGTGAGNGVLFNNTLDSCLIVNQAGTTASTLTVNVGSTVLGQAVTNFTANIPGTVGVYIIGPFHTALNQAGSGNVAIDFSSATGITVGAFQLGNVF
jgi:hypothetical protein